MTNLRTFQIQHQLLLIGGEQTIILFIIETLVVICLQKIYKLL